MPNYRYKVFKGQKVVAVSTTLREAEAEARRIGGGVLAIKNPAVAAPAKAKDLTKTAAFKRWFGDSKVVDKNGKPLVVYHGSPEYGFKVFDLEKIDAHHVGFFFTDKRDMANTYAEGKPGQRPKRSGIYEVYLRIEEPFEVDAKGAIWDNIPLEYEDWDGTIVEERASTTSISRTARDLGHDGCIIHNVYDGWGDQRGDVFVVFKPNQVKSVDNRGTFSRYDDNIRNPTAKNTILTEPIDPARSRYYLNEAEKVLEKELRKKAYEGYTLRGGTLIVVFDTSNKWPVVQLRPFQNSIGLQIGSKTSYYYTLGEVLKAALIELRENAGLPLDPAADQTKSAAFKAWFGNSKVVKGGKPLVVYHGTRDGGFTEFRLDKIDAHHNGFFFTSHKPTALSYSGGYTKPLPLKERVTFGTIADFKRWQQDPKNQPLSYQFRLWEYADDYIDEDGNPTGEQSRVWSVEFEGRFLVDKNGSQDFTKPNELLRAIEDALATRRQVGLYGVYLSIQNPLVVNCQGKFWDRIPRTQLEKAGVPATSTSGMRTEVKTYQITRIAKDLGYDGVIFKRVIDYGSNQNGEPGDVYVAFEPTQIKSATANVGTFSKTDPDIRNPRKKNPERTFIPPPAVAAEARKALDLRAKQPPSNRCCTPVGIARAKQLANRQPVSETTLRRMKAYFDRHAVDAKGKGWGVDSKGWQAWLAWGGTPGRKWCENILRSL